MYKRAVVFGLLMCLFVPVWAKSDKVAVKKPSLGAIAVILVEVEKESEKSTEDSMIQPEHKIKKRKRVIIKTVLSK